MQQRWLVLGTGLLVAHAGCGGDDVSADRDGSLCGDGVVQPPEACDDRNTIDDDLCRNDCLTRPPLCGNGVVDPTEGCDDGDTPPGDGCSPACLVERSGDGAPDVASPGHWPRPSSRLGASSPESSSSRRQARRVAVGHPIRQGLSWRRTA